MSDSAPWYRHPWVWGVILIPFSAVAFGIVMITTVTLFPDDVVVDNYYQEGKAINERIGMDVQAERQGIEVTSRVLSGDEIAFHIENADDSIVVLNLYHVTDASKDRRLVLLPESGQIWRANADGPLPFDQAGVWYVELEGADGGWRVRSRVVTPVQHLEIAAR